MQKSKQRVNQGIGKKPVYSNIQFVKDLWYFLKKKKAKFLFYTSLLVVASLLSLLTPIIIAEIINYFTEGGSEARVFYYYLLALFAIGVIATITRLRGKFYLGLYNSYIQKESKVEAYQKIMQADLIWHDKENTGNKMQKVFEGEQSIGKFMDFYINKFISSVVTLFGVIAVFLFFDIKYALIAFFFIFTYLYVELKLNKKLSKAILEVKLANEQASGKAYEFSSNISTVKSLGMEDSSKNQIVDNEEDVYNKKLKRQKISNLKWISIQLIATFFFALFLFFVGRDVLSGALAIGLIVVYVDYVGRLSNVLNTVSNQSNKIIEIKYGLYRMMEIFRIVPEINEEGAKKLNGWKKISFKNIGFKYKEEPVLNDFNLEINKGDKIGIVGRSGCGKSTLFKLLLKLYLPKKGMIYFDNRSINQIKRDSITKRISIVPQDTELFNLSLRENITISNQGRFNSERYKNAIRISQVDKIINKLKNKDMTLVGEKGVRLSGGEKQRIGIARAIYKDSDIIIMDESTSNLDYATEKQIQKNLQKLKDKTLIIAAHRLSTLEHTDKIIYLRSGKIIEKGSFNELLQKKGKFYRLWIKQRK